MVITCSVDPRPVRMDAICGMPPRPCVQVWSGGMSINSDAGAAPGVGDRASSLQAISLTPLN